MRTQQTVLDYARSLAEQLQKDMSWKASDRGGYWVADDKKLMSILFGRAAAALEFFRQYAGPESHWTERANQVYLEKGDRQSLETGIHAIGDLLRAWCDQVEAGIAEIVGAHAWQEYGEAGTDLMEQARRLLADRETHPAAPIVLCGAALEMALRALVEARGLALEQKNPSINAYAALLQSNGVITKQDHKDITACAGLRNAAAHGEHDELSRERAGLMEQHTNLLLRRLASLHIVTPAET
ncbi:hypothetical protein [Nonomuraea cavernae]|uniref:DUF4145 domain-containing protein n=1 Tax=Nonomuraea cavernae TaxID=2045107 RepID=A0A918DQC9_9ACTN|nr:hypothetical protein [Nonomuraea cavernae]MCA2186402.1 hypothetical protein [Nonomuraea cavernae]GGO79234.1 hypothetical protein GCM10012289_63050 [Nonomuraea cavernae]